MDRSRLAVGLYLAWFVIGVAGRSLVHRARTGSSGIHLPSGRAGGIEWVAGILVVLGIGGGATGAAAYEEDSAIDPLASDALLIVGVVVFALGALAMVAAQFAMGASWRVGVDHDEHTDLVTDGPFQIARNPIFTTMVVASVGLFLIAPNLITAGALVALVIAVELQVRAVEEPHLLRHHGDAYRSYAANVGRFVPGLGRLRP